MWTQFLGAVSTSHVLSSNLRFWERLLCLYWDRVRSTGSGVSPSTPLEVDAVRNIIILTELTTHWSSLLQTGYFGVVMSEIQGSIRLNVED